MCRMEVGTNFVSFGDSFFTNKPAPTLKKKLTIWRVAELTGPGSTGSTLRACWCVVMKLTSSLYIGAKRGYGTEFPSSFSSIDQIDSVLELGCILDLTFF